MEYPQQPMNQFQPGMNGPVSEEDLGSLKLNYWLSVFFTIIPALIFYFIKKGRNQTVDSYLKSNLIFSAIRCVVAIIYTYLSVSTALTIVQEAINNPGAASSAGSSLINTVMMLLGLVLFIVHIVLAATLNSRISDGKGPMFLG